MKFGLENKKTDWAQSDVDLLDHIYCGSDKTASLGCTLIAYALGDHRYCKTSTGTASVLKDNNYYLYRYRGVAIRMEFIRAMNLLFKF